MNRDAPNESEDEDSQYAAQERLVEALLEGAYDSNRGYEDIRVESVMKRIRGDALDSGRRVIPIGHRSRVRRWIAVAASFIVILTLAWYQSQSSSKMAWAVVEKSITSTAEDVVRHYQMRITRASLAQENLEVESDLFVQGNERILLVRPGFIAPGTLRIGLNRDIAWMVPPAGPVRVGSKSGLGHWLAENRDPLAQNLQIAEILQWLKLGYGVKVIGEESFALEGENAEQVICHHLRGTLLSNGSRPLPATIDLWSAKDSGLVVRIQAVWNAPRQPFGLKRMELRWMGSPVDLPPDWYDYSTYSEDRMVLGWELPSEKPSPANPK